MFVLGVPEEVGGQPDRQWPRRNLIIVLVLWITWALLTGQLADLASLLTAATGLLAVCSRRPRSVGLRVSVRKCADWWRLVGRCLA